VSSRQEEPAPGDRPDRAGEPASFDTTVAHPARVYDYLLGGKDNYEADRDAAEQALEVMPSVADGARANRAFLRRAVEYLAGEAGIRQFLDIGTGLPTADNTHEVAQRIAPDARIVYVDNDPIVLAHSRALLDSAPGGATAYIQADVRDPAGIVREAAATLDFTQPVAVILLAVLHFVPDDEHPEQITAALMDPMAAGSYLTISALTDDISAEQVTRVARDYNAQRVAAHVYPRTHAEIARCFGDLDLVEPGLVPIKQWRSAAEAAGQAPAYGGVARKR
jgi:S-adenosyl methyltransferase